MSTRLPKATSDINAWTTFNNVFNVHNIGNEFIDIALNGNNPPTIKQYTRAMFYVVDSAYTIAATPATGNNEYAAGDNNDYLVSEAVYEDSADVTFTWAGSVRGETIATQSDGTWYILLKGSLNTDDSTIGQGTYNFSKTETPTWNNIKGGWYSSGGYKVLGSFDSVSGTVSELVVYQSDKVIQGSIAPAITPHKIGMNYINTTTGIIYQSKATSSSADWVDVSTDKGGTLSIHAVSNANYTILDGDGYDVIEMTLTTAATTITLPTVADNEGRTITCKLVDEGADYDDYLTVDGEGAETIDGESSFRMNGDNDYITIYSNGTEWKKINSKATYETGWINRSDWTSVEPGSNTSLNTNSAISHNLNQNLSNLRVMFFVSTDGTDSNSFSQFEHTASATNQGYTVHQTSVNSATLYIGDRLRFVNSSNSVTTLDTENYYYKIIVERIR